MNLLNHWRGLLVASLLTFCGASVHAQVTIDPPADEDLCKLSELDLTSVTYFNDGEGNGVNADRGTFGTPLLVRDTTYTTGVGTHAPSKFVVQVNGATDFHAVLGIDDAAAVNADGSFKPNEGVVNFTVKTYAADKTETVLYSGVIDRRDKGGYKVDVDLTGAVYMVLDFESGANTWSDHVDVCDAYFHYKGKRPSLIIEGLMWPDPSTTVDLPEAAEGQENIPLSSLDLTKATCGYGSNMSNRSSDGNPIKLGGITYTSGVGTHAPSQIIVKLNGSVTRFYTRVGIDDEVRAAAAQDGYARAAYRVYLKGQDGSVQEVSQGVITGKDTEYPEIDVDVNGWKYLFLETENGADGTNYSDHVDWANAYFVYQEQNSTRPVIVTAEEISSKLDCATTVFSQPGVRFMHKVRAANPDAVVTVKDLPAGLSWNAKRQLVEGIVEKEGKYTYRIDLDIDGETTTENVDFTVSKDLQQPVPFMGWVSWNSVESEISESIVKQVADLFEDKGLYDCGWNTIVMDDWWHADTRAADGKPQPNATRFPNGLKPVADYVHSKGMKFGLYTDAAERTCAGAFGSYGYEEIDAKQYADWDIDIVKCDYCNAPSDAETAKTRYKALGDALKDSGRDIILYICEWGVREPWKWGTEAGGTCWRVSYDVRDCWIGQDPGVGVTQSIKAMKDLANWQGVNRFNDADMLCTGLHGTGKSSSDLCASGAGMTQDEYRTQFALWCMWSSPMALSFDPRSAVITDDDYAIMTNKELIALNQDRMGQQADVITSTNDMLVMAKDCENGDIAISFTNLSGSQRTETLDFSTLPHLDENADYTCRDLWEKADLADVKGALTTTVRSHATKVFRLSKKGTSVGISQGAASTGQITIKPVGGQGIKITAPATTGVAKRVLVSDTAGRVAASKTFDADDAVVKVADGTYIVSVFCNARAITAKVQL